MKIAAILAFAWLAACEAPGASTGLLQADQFEDIPVPRAARCRTHHAESFSYRTDTFRCGKFVYDYQGTVAEVVRYFRDTMARAPFSWELKDASGTAEGSTTLVFTKNDERCTVDIDRIPRPETKEQDVLILVRLNYKYHR